MAQWIRRLPTEQEILGSSPSTGFFFCLVKKRYSGRGLNSRPSACKADVITTRLPEPNVHNSGVVAQMVERTLSMREAQGSIPCYSTFFFACCYTTNVADKATKKRQPMGGFEPPTFRLLSECSTPKLHWLTLFSMVSPCGAMDSASDFGSGGWGFESPQGL
jgi:hypothetical protein